LAQAFSRAFSGRCLSRRALRFSSGRFANIVAMKASAMTDYASTKASDDAGAAPAVSVVGALVDPDLLVRMQLTAMGLRGRLFLSKCCGCTPLRPAGLLICIYMLFRGIFSLMETFPSGVLIDFFPVVFSRFNSTNPFMALAYALLVVSGPVDIVASLLGVVGIVTRNASVAASVFIWMLVRMFFTIVFVVTVVGFDTPQLGVWWDLSIASVWLLMELYFIYIFFEVLLLTLLQGTVATSMLNLLGTAKKQARNFSHDRCGMLHLLAAMLQDEVCCNLLALGGVDVHRMAVELTRSLDDDQKTPGWAGDADMPLNREATEIIAASLQLQRLVGDDKLTADHVLMTLCGGGVIRFGRSSASVNSAAIRDELARRRAIERPATPPGAKLFGCLQLEETVAVYLVMQVAACIISIGCLAVFGRSIGSLWGLRTVPEMRSIELFASLSGILMGILAIWGISSNRSTRQEVRDEAKKHGVTHRQVAEANLDVAFAVVSLKEEVNDEGAVVSLSTQVGHRDKYHCGRQLGPIALPPSGGHCGPYGPQCESCNRFTPQAEVWLNILRRSVTFLGAYLVWDAAQLFVQLPMIGMLLTIGDICGANVHGLINISSMGLFTNAAPMHCSYRDILVIIKTFVYLLVDAYMFWGTLTLWHEYKYGWTTTDPRGIEYLDPIGPLPQSVVRQLSGLPLKPRERKFASDRLMDPSETRPLLL